MIWLSRSAMILWYVCQARKDTLCAINELLPEAPWYECEGSAMEAVFITGFNEKTQGIKKKGTISPTLANFLT